jgi:hypothetical protein
MKYNIATILALLLLTSCASPYQARKEQLEAFHDTIQRGLERDGMPREQAAKMALVETWQYAQQLQQQGEQARQTQALEKIANTARQPPYNPYTASGGVPPQEMNANQQGSVTFIPDAAGSQWGTIWGPNGVQRVEKTSDGGFRIWP